MPRARGRPLHHDLPDQEFGPERPAYERVPEIVEGNYFEHEGPFGTVCSIEGIVVDPETVERIDDR